MTKLNYLMTFQEWNEYVDSLEDNIYYGEEEEERKISYEFYKEHIHATRKLITNLVELHGTIYEKNTGLNSIMKTTQLFNIFSQEIENHIEQIKKGFLVILEDVGKSSKVEIKKNNIFTAMQMYDNLCKEMVYVKGYGHQDEQVYTKDFDSKYKLIFGEIYEDEQKNKYKISIVEE